MTKNIRVYSQQLINPVFNNPKDLLSWMGAIQAQHYDMSKWAVGIRLQSATIKEIEQSIQKGEILRTHVMRPTWHLVTAEDIRWMLKLTGEQIIKTTRSRDKYLELDESHYTKTNNLLEKMLAGNNHLTRLEIAEQFSKAGIEVNNSRMIHFMMRAESEGIVCNGIDKGKKTTYALLEERVMPTKELHKEEALAKLATKYFQSHSPATLADFVWWSGLLIKDARHAIGLIDSELMIDKSSTEIYYIHKSYKDTQEVKDILHYLPPFDEFIISYKDRTHVIELVHQPKAFTNNGIFYPTIMYNGKIVGNWEKPSKKNTPIKTSYFIENILINDKLKKIAEQKYLSFISNK